MITWIVSIYIGFVALLSPILPHKAVVVATAVPVTIEAPKGVVTGGTQQLVASQKALVHGASLGVNNSDAPATTSLINPNSSFMETHVPENTPEPVEVEKVDTKPEYIAPPEEDAPLNGLDYSTKGY